MKNILLVLAAIVIIGAVKPLDFHSATHVPVDDVQYRMMAEQPGQFNPQTWEPYGYRFLGPWLVGFLFSDIDLGYRVFTSLFLILIALCMYRILLIYGMDEKISLLVTFAFILNRYFIPFLAYEFYRLDDAISVLFLWLAILLSREKRIVWALPLLVIGLMAREILVLWVPVSLVILLQRRAQKSEYFVWAGYGAVLFVAFVATHAMIPVQGGIELSQALWDDWNKLIDPFAMAKQLFVVHSPLFLLPLIFYRALIEFSKKYPEILTLLVFTYLSSLFGHDYERLMMPAAPFIYLFTANIMTQMKGSSPRNVAWFSLLFIAISMAANLYHLWGIVLLPDRTTSMVLTIIVGILMGGLFWIYSRNDSGKPFRELD